MENTKIVSHSYCSYEKDVDREFVKQLVADAVEVLGDYRSGLLFVGGYNPPWLKQPRIKGVEYQPGHLSLSFYKPNDLDGECLDLDLIFGYYDKGRFICEKVDKDALKNRPGCAWATAYNFDEAWQIICLIGEQLEISQVRLTCGGA